MSNTCISYKMNHMKLHLLVSSDLSSSANTIAWSNILIMLQYVYIYSIFAIFYVCLILASIHAPKSVDMFLTVNFAGVKIGIIF